jgi:hypothetical protein
MGLHKEDKTGPDFESGSVARGQEWFFLQVFFGPCGYEILFQCFQEKYEDYFLLQILLLSVM